MNEWNDVLFLKAQLVFSFPATVSPQSLGPFNSEAWASISYVFSNSDPEALLCCSEPKQNIHFFEPINKYLGSKLNLECVTQEIPALCFILSLTFKTCTVPDLKCTK